MASALARSKHISRLLENARKRAKERRLKFELNAEWVATAKRQKRCPLTGLPFDWSAVKSRGVPSPLSPSLNRLDPTLGYTPSNTRIVCLFANVAKNVWTDAEFRLLVLATAKHLE